MKRYIDIINSSTLPTSEQLFDYNYQITNFGQSYNIINSIVNSNVVLQTSIEEFFNFCNKHNINEILCTYDLYETSEYLITSKLFEDDLYDFTKYVISKYNTNLNEDEQMEYFIKNLQIEISKLPIIAKDNDDTDNTDDTDDIVDIDDFIKLIDTDDSLDEDDEIDEDTLCNKYELSNYSLSTIASKLLTDIITFNEGIPEEMLTIIKTLKLSCVLNGIVYSIIILNDIDFNIDIRLAEILSKYQNKYEENIHKSIEIIKQKNIKAEQEKQLAEAKREQDYATFIDSILHDPDFIVLTNDSQRQMFISDIYNNKSNIYRDLMMSSYSLNKFIERDSDLPISITKTILQDIKAKALKYKIKLGSKIMH